MGSAIAGATSVRGLGALSEDSKRVLAELCKIGEPYFNEIYGRELRPS